MSERPQRPNEDFIDRKAGFIERMFKAMFESGDKNIYVTIIIALVFFGFTMTYLYVNSVKDRLEDSKEYFQHRIQDNERYNENLINEISRRLMPEINREVERRTEKIETKVDSAASSVKTMKDALIETLEKQFR